MKSLGQLQNGRAREMCFLVIALAAHAVLLLLPLKSWQVSPTPTPETISVQLRAMPQTAKVTPPLEALIPEKRLQQPATELLEIPTLPVPAPAQPEFAQEPENEAKEPIPPATEVQPEVRPPSALHLRQSFEESKPIVRANENTRQLGDQPAYTLPDNWKANAGAPYLAEFENTFNGMTVPNEVEIVDRWIASDGSHRVVMNLPNGQTMCGRAEAYNPMQPLFEPVMLFGSCGGGGKRTFSIPEQYKRDR